MTSNITDQFTTESPCDEGRRLAMEIADLQTRLDFLLELEADEDDPETWNIWPYSWAVAGWNQARTCFHSFHQKQNGSADCAFDSAASLRLV